MKYMKSIHLKRPLTIALSVILLSFIPPESVKQLQMDLLIHTVNSGKRITTKGQVYYEVSNAKLVTHFTYPVELITITNALGEMQSYDFKKNNLLIQNGRDFSSKQSFIYHFMSGAYSDMGLPEEGFELKDSKIEDGMVITNWKIKSNARQDFANFTVELVHENRLPIYMGFSNNGQVVSKTYYTNYQVFGGVRMPLKITEIVFTNDGADSTITQKNYSGVKLNEEVDLTYLNFKVPEDANIVKQ